MKKLYKTIEETMKNAHKHDAEALEKGMVKLTDNVAYDHDGELYKPKEESKKDRAFSYALTITALNDVGAGADENLYTIRNTIGTIRAICLHETGYLVDKYATKLVGSDYSGWKPNPYRKQKEKAKK